MSKRILAIVLGLGFILGLSYPVDAAGVPESSIEVTIPQYEVQQIDGFDYVDIPGGDVLLVDGKPRVPYYPLTIDYATGYRVQDVVMSEVSGLTTATGLNLPLVVMQPDTASDADMTTPPIEQAGWYPEDDFNWGIWANSDGSSSLVIAIYPFYYNAETTESRFYSDYRFDIEYIYSSVEITSFNTDSYIYTPGEDVVLDLQLSNSGEERDVVLELTIKNYMSDELIYGFPIKSLKDLVGEGSYSDTWNTSSINPGDYYAEAVIVDTYGNILDSKTAGFSIQTIDIAETPPAITATASDVTQPTSTTKEQGELPTRYLICGIVLALIIVIVVILIVTKRHR
jgi:hypothetical protein